MALEAVVKPLSSEIERSVVVGLIQIGVPVITRVVTKGTTQPDLIQAGRGSEIVTRF